MSQLDWCIEYASRHIHNYMITGQIWSWCMAEVWLSRASYLMLEGL